ncbi:hypothetical protein GCM10010517_64970 [Streptosporangium fragile]|uniref:Uncharacterized protein n=1 Tax=Streptosporangium fragile TaxID=46186 RepID=A0ABN3W5W2_9ACTN
MTDNALQRAQISRRNMLLAGFFGVLGSQLVLVPGTAPRAEAADAPTLPGEGYTISATGGTVTVLDAAGVSRLVLRGYRLGTIVTNAGTSAVGTAPDGTAAIVVTYDTGTPQTSIKGTFTPRGRRLEVVFDITSSTVTSASSGMMRRQVVPSSVVETYTGIAAWARDPRGGVPYQTAGTAVYEEAFPGVSVYITGRGSNSSWRDSGALHLPATQVQTGVFRATANIVVTEPARPQIVGAIAEGSPLAVDLWTDRPFNVWTGADQPLTVRGIAYNGAAGRRLTLKWKVRDFDGRVLARRVTSSVAGAGAVTEDTVSFRARGRGVYFVELQVKAGDQEVLSRTNVAVLPPHDFGEAGSATTIGIAADYLFSTTQERELLQRLGVRWSRHPQFTAAELAQYGLHQNRLRTPASPEAFDGDPEGLRAYIDEELTTAENAQAVYYELANEWNMKGGILKGVGGAEYVTKWATAFAQRIAERGSSLRLMSVALAGMDYVYAERMFSAGLTQHVKAFALHPGRGNFTPDYAPDPSEWTQGSNGSYWNFLGAIRKAKEMIAAQPGEPIELWLTEAYACTKPNSWWHDTYRHAAENVLLSQALAVAEGVRASLWYQFYDNVKANPYGASETNPEYHFGLVMRDKSPKPSLLAFAAASEALDGATFVRWVRFPDENLRGLLFDTPRGPMSILWSRADGYILNADHEAGTSFYPSPEPWVDPWPTKTTVRLPATGRTVRQIDCIGREVKLPVSSGGTAEVKLDGAPRVYYGLDLAAFGSGE